MVGVLSILVLCLSLIQDLKQRAIHLFVFIALILAFCFAKYWNDLPIFSIHLILNYSFVLLLIIVILMYFRFRFGSWDLFKIGLGEGDLVFWLLVGFYLDFEMYVIWFNSSLIIALIGHAICRNFNWYGNTSKIPLAGWQALPLILLILLYP